MKVQCSIYYEKRSERGTYEHPIFHCNTGRRNPTTETDATEFDVKT